MLVGNPRDDSRESITERIKYLHKTIMSRDSDLDEDITKQNILNEKTVGDVTVENQHQIRRIFDRVDRIQETVDNNNEELVRNGEKIRKLQNQLEEVKNKQNQIEIDTPSNVRKKITIPIIVSLLAFAIISVAVALLRGNDIPLGTQLATAGSLGLLSLEIIDYLR